VIHYVGADLKANLAAHLCPFDVVDGPERRPTTTGSRERVVIEHDPSGGDSFKASHLQGPGPPRTVLVRDIAYKVTIYAKSPHPGAAVWEHRQRAERVLDLVVVGLYQVAKVRKNLVTLKSGKFVDPPDIKDSETPGYATYELLLNFDRGVTDQNWDGSESTVITIVEGMIQNTTKANGETAAGTGNP
jgi:hypothetical protein